MPRRRVALHNTLTTLTVALVGRQALYEVDREMPIVGGTGVFRMARGYAVCNTCPKLRLLF
ncbi:hypothetical protein ACS0TY_003244 [Phlomoides rotata]